jgi:hypothetical protein
MNVRLFTDRRIRNRYWTRLMPYEGKNSWFYNLIELKISSNKRVTFLITEQMVYHMLSEDKLTEYTVKLIINYKTNFK